MKHLLFSYGTLQYEKVQLESFGRILKGNKDVLEGYRLEKLEITDKEVLTKSEQSFHPIAVKTNNPDDFIKGILFEITEQELLQADAYEVDDYTRVWETFKSGKQGWVYVSHN